MNLRRKCRPEKLAFAKQMRKKPTRSEAILWEELRSLRSVRVKFRRQVVLRGYIADFYCPAAKLVVEVDGPSHNPIKDGQRDRNLSKVGISTVRFTNAQVHTSLPQVLVVIRGAYRNRLKYLTRKRFAPKRKAQKRTFSTIPQDSSSSSSIPMKNKEIDDCPCGYVQMSDKFNNCIKLVRLPLFESLLTPKENNGACQSQAFASLEVAENFARIETTAGRESSAGKCPKCRQFHVFKKVLTRLAVVR